VPDHPTPFDGASAAARLRALRAELLALLETLPETRLGGALEREGWTLRHELASLAASDVELAHVLDALRGRADGAVELAVRRLRGEAMLHAQQMRLHVLRAHLAVSIEAATGVLEHAGELLERPLAIAGRDVHSAREYVAGLVAQAESARDAVRTATGR